MPLPFEEYQAKGLFDFSSFSSSSYSSSSSSPESSPEIPIQKWANSNNNSKQNWCYVGIEPTSVLDARRSPSPPTSSSTLSCSQGGSNGGGSGGVSADTTTGMGATAAAVDLSSEKCGQLRMEDWDGVLPGSPSQEQSILGLIMGDIEDPSVGLNKLLQSENGSQGMEFNTGFGVVDQGFGFENINASNLFDTIYPSLQTPSDFPLLAHNARIGLVFNQNPNFLPPPVEEKPQIFNTQLITNQNQAQFTQNPAMYLPFSYTQLHEHHLLSPPPTKRLNSGPIEPNSELSKVPTFLDSRPPEFFLQQPVQHQLQMQQQWQGLMKQKIMTATNEQITTAQQLQQAVIHTICQAAELIETGNLALAQGILARLNHQLSLSIGKPQIRAAFYFKEALQFLLHNTNPSSSVSPCNLIFRIGAFKSFSEISPILQFSNFTCNQALIEACDGFDTIHIVDFDIGYGEQWASLMQELAMRNGSCPSLKITAFASYSSRDELELAFTRESLKLFANEINIPFELDIVGIEAVNSGSYSMPVGVSEKQVIGVNLPVSPFSNHPSSLPVVLRFVKQLSPKIVVSLDRGCDRTDLPFANHVNHCIQSYSTLLESLEAVNMNFDALQKIERFLIQPNIEKIVWGRHQNPERTSPWRSLFLQSGFTPFQFSNFAESQAECLVQRTPVRGFHVEKKQSSLVLCWQRKELVSASGWRC